MYIRKSLFLLLLCIVGIFSFSCKKKSQSTELNPLVLDSVMVVKFAQQWESAVNCGDTALLLQTFDKLFAKNQVSENSLIKSSFDSDFGTFFFDAYFQNVVLNLVETINNGGHFMCTRVYQKDSVFHFVTHLYNDLTLRIDDWQLAVVDNEIKIQDGFFYNLSSSMINDLNYWMLYQIMEKTNPGGATTEFAKINDAIIAGNTKLAMQSLAESRMQLAGYPSYWQLYLKTLFEDDYDNFIARFEADVAPNFDSRSVQLHELIYNACAGNVEATEQNVYQLIPYCGDAPIFLFFAGFARLEAKEYRDAAVCFENLDGILPLFWDLWCAKLECFYYLNDVKSFESLVNEGRKMYGMTAEEISQFIDSQFPKMKNINYSE